MIEVAPPVSWSAKEDADVETVLAREWLVTNGLGGYAGGTVAGVATRRYHGLLVAALPTPLGRTMMLNHLEEEVVGPGDEPVSLGGHELHGRAAQFHHMRHLQRFRLDDGLPVWTYTGDGWAIEKRILMPHGQNTTYVTYSRLSGERPLRLRLTPGIHFRPHDRAVSFVDGSQYSLTIAAGRYEVTSAEQGLPPLRLAVHGGNATFAIGGREGPELHYRVEAHRGYEAVGKLWIPGSLEIDLSAEGEASLIASVEPWEVATALAPKDAADAESERRRRLVAGAYPEAVAGMGRQLVLAADQFIVTPPGRVADAARARATGDEPRTLIAGYHWFTDWGRDTMISLEGLTLVTGRHAASGSILRSFARYVRDGLIPNLFPEGRNEGLYHTADATLWFFHAVDRYLAHAGDRATLRLLLPTLRDIVERHIQGTRFGIGMDETDGLLRQGAEGYQLTWMDAKVGDWVVTPRRGKAVEINALWYNALRLMHGWLKEERTQSWGDLSSRLAGLADRVHESFNRRFWYTDGGYLYDVVDGPEGDDPACRPNQLLAISLPNAVLEPSRWRGVVQVARERLLTPIGLRSLAPGHRDYRLRYFGDIRARDAAYHQGTVWAWLIGPFIDAWLRVDPGHRGEAREFLKGFEAHLGEACLGTVSEIADAESPFTPRGCVAQAWSVAEVLRTWVKTADSNRG